MKNVKALPLVMLLMALGTYFSLGASTNHSTVRILSPNFQVNNTDAEDNLFNEYLWLERVVDVANCENTRIIEYAGNGDGYRYIQIINPTSNTIYYALWGIRICRSEDSNSCKDAAELGEVLTEWNCGDPSCVVFETCPNKEVYFRLERYFYRTGIGPNCEHLCDEVTAVTISPMTNVVADGLIGYRLSPSETTTYTITYTVGGDSGPIGGDCNDTDVTCTPRTFTKNVCVVVEDCGRCDEPVTAEEFIASREGDFELTDGIVIMEHFGPAVGYFYEVKRKCPFNAAQDFNGAFYACSGELICVYGNGGWGGFPSCAGNLYELDFSLATTSKVIYDSDCEFNPIRYSICQGESAFLPYNDTGIEQGNPVTYACASVNTTIEQIGNPVDRGDGFTVTPIETTTYNVLVNFPNGDCPPRKYSYLVEVNPNCGTGQPTVNEDLPMLLQAYPWLSDKLDFEDCAGVSVEIYEENGYSYVFINDGITNQMYYQNGLFYCQDAPNYSCKSAYGLGIPSAIWTCGNNVRINDDFRAKLTLDNSPEKLEVSPNPAKEKVQLTIPFANQKIGKITLYNANGQLIQTHSLAENQSTTFELDLQTLPAGLYLINYQSNTYSEVVKLVVE